MDKNSFKQYRRVSIAEMRPATEADRGDETISISQPDIAMGSPRTGDMIARNPENHDDRWLVAAEYFTANFAPLASHPGKETSSRVSSIAANLIYTNPDSLTAAYHAGSIRLRELAADIRSLAASCMSQDETPGQSEKK